MLSSASKGFFCVYSTRAKRVALCGLIHSFVPRLIPLLRARRARAARWLRGCKFAGGGDKKLPPKSAISPDLFHLAALVVFRSLSRAAIEDK